MKMNSRDRLLIAEGEAQDRSIKFIIKFLARRRIDITKYFCTSTIVLKKIRCKLKDFKHIGAGGVGVIKECSNCRMTNEGIYMCRNNPVGGDANKLIIFPFVDKKIIPKSVLISIETTSPNGLIGEKKTYVFE